MIAKGYSLNILPSGKEYESFVRLIKKLAERYGGPVFAPHITLLGQAAEDETTAIKLSEKLTAEQEPFTVILDRVDYEDYYFRALFIYAKKTEPLESLHNMAKKIFNKGNIPPYMPHLSLLYGDFPISLKEKIISEIGKEMNTTFTVNSVWLFKTEGLANEWYPVKEFIFKR